MTLADVYCRFNRARGMEVFNVLMNVEEELRFHMCGVYYAMPEMYTFSFQLVSPDDLVNACKMFEPLKLPLRYVHPSLALQPDSHFVATPTIGVSASFRAVSHSAFLNCPEKQFKGYICGQESGVRDGPAMRLRVSMVLHPNLF